MSERRRTIIRALSIAALLVTLLVAAAWSDDAALVSLQLSETGSPYRFGSWLQGELDDESLTVRWPDLDEQGALADDPACIVTWSSPDRSGGDAKRLRGHVRGGGGAVYVIGEGEEHIRQARSIWGPLDVDVRRQDQAASDALWASHPLTGGGGSLGAVTAGSSLSGPGGSPLIRAGGVTLAMAFDWGPLGRAVLLDHSIIFDQLHESTPRPAVQDFLVRAVRWAAGVAEEEETPAQPDRPETPTIEELLGDSPVGPPEHERTLVALPEEGDYWPDIRPRIMAELEREDLDIRVPRVQEGEPIFTPDRLDRVGLLVMGSGREQVHWEEPLAIAWFLSRGGRMLCIPHAGGRHLHRIVSFNRLINSLRIAISLERSGGPIRLHEHAITEELTVPEDVRARSGLRVWAPLATPLLTVKNEMGAVVLQRDQARVVLIDGELLRIEDDRGRLQRDVRSLLSRSLEWLLGEL